MRAGASGSKPGGFSELLFLPKTNLLLTDIDSAFSMYLNPVPLGIMKTDKSVMIPLCFLLRLSCHLSFPSLVGLGALASLPFLCSTRWPWGLSDICQAFRQVNESHWLRESMMPPGGLFKRKPEPGAATLSSALRVAGEDTELPVVTAS